MNVMGGTKLDCLKDWCWSKKIFSTNDVKRWGMENYYSSSDVRCRELARGVNPFLRSIPDDEAILRGLTKKGNAKVRFYEIA